MLVKLFIAMGLTWILELIALAISLSSNEGDIPQWVSIILNIANVLQGIVIFIVFGIKPSVRNHIKENYFQHNSVSSPNRRSTQRFSFPVDSSNGSTLQRNSVTRPHRTLMNSVSYSPATPSNDGSDNVFFPSSDS